MRKKDVTALFDLDGEQISVPDYYNSLIEAKISVRRLRIYSQLTYWEKKELDPKLPPNPPRQYANDWRGWDDFLIKKLRDHYYPTWQQASESAIKLNIRSAREYDAKRYLDLRLHSQPRFKYPDWPGWDTFLQRKPKPARGPYYPNIYEAAAAVATLGIKTKTEYALRYDEDPRLPADPWNRYKKYWRSNGGWYGFFNRRKPTKKYANWKICSEAAIRLGIQSQPEYERRYREDPRLYSHPDQKFYRVWKAYGGWPAFLGRTRRHDAYETLNEVIGAIRKLGIITQAEYLRRFHEDPKLRARPDRTYRNAKPINWQQIGGWNGLFAQIRLAA
ncbi:hypothetical protein KJ611_00125 [Patescibacteria group bacterium]|nr:hypothetical protein [Patescibacteria group bacterium]MBU1705791.1 hypothetical protein [Patescibacteria group bacterium]